MRALVVAVLAVAGCHQNEDPPCQCGTGTTPSDLSCNEVSNHCEGGFTVVGHSDLFGRGQNAALTIAGTTAYVGSRTDGFHQDPGVVILDIADPSNPTPVGMIGPPEEGVIGVSPVELRAVPNKNLLVVMNSVCDPGTNDCGFDLTLFPDTGGVAETANLKFYDITDPRTPRRVGIFDFGFHPHVGDVRSNPHEMFIWEDPVNVGRVLVYVTALPGDPNLRVIDVSDPANPTLIATWDTFQQTGLPRQFLESLHSLSVSPDGRTAYLAHLGTGFFMLDTSEVADNMPSPLIDFLTPYAGRIDYSPPVGPVTHSAVKLPNRDVVVITDEGLPYPFDGGCPWGYAATIDISNPLMPRFFERTVRNPSNTGDDIITEGLIRLPANVAETCPPKQLQDRIAISAHNPTVTDDLLFLAYYSGGLQVFQLTDVRNPVQVAAFYPEPITTVAMEDPQFGGYPSAVWSYPIIQDGLVYVVDIRNGLYVLRYDGPLAETVQPIAHLEGNSNLR
ncbi:MAG: hypothetical protein ABI867_14365 [Kofleriaceae bacterium]